ncbi:copper ion binding protein [Catenulispora sp. GAS73]|uniref:heavy-metal-associated domain-containing protein n=1 Tax=Catenulispora sp. GAS73 TaxID=3156269 RepID=UPI003514602E
MNQLTVIQPEAAAASGCSCCATPAAEATEAVAAEPKETIVSENVTTAVYTVSGMTCGHCVNSVTEEVGAIDGVRNVDVVLETGEVTVTSAAPLTVEAVQAAVDEAGYTLVH